MALNVKDYNSGGCIKGVVIQNDYVDEVMTAGMIVMIMKKKI